MNKIKPPKAVFLKTALASSITVMLMQSPVLAMVDDEIEEELMPAAPPIVLDANNSGVEIFDGIFFLSIFNGSPIDDSSAIFVNNADIVGFGFASSADRVGGVVDFQRDSSLNGIINNGLISGVGTNGISVGSATGSETLIENNGVITSDTTDAINLSGTIDIFFPDAVNPPPLPDSPSCFQTDLCQFDLTLVNDGEISTDSTNIDNAAIRIEEDSIVLGSITNNGDITGAVNGISVDGAFGNHDLLISNTETGTIEGTDGSGVTISSFGVSLINEGTIVGNTGLTIEADAIGSFVIFRADDASSLDVNDEVATNTFINSGTIEGTGGIAVDASNSALPFTFTQTGTGVLNGDFVGSTALDTLSVDATEFVLTGDVLSNVDVNIGSDASLELGGEGSRLIDGNLTSDGELLFTLGEPELIVTGDVALNAGSTVVIDAANNVVTSGGQQFTLIDASDTSVVSNDASVTISNVVDESFLLDFAAVVNSDNDLVVEAVAATALNNISSGDTNVDLLSEQVVAAFNSDLNSGVNSALSENVFTSLQGLNEQEFISAIADLLPSLTNATTQELFSSIRSANGFISNRVEHLFSSNHVNSTEIVSNNPLNVKEAVYSVDESGNGAYVLPVQHNASSVNHSNKTGAWVQGSFTNSDQDNESELVATSTSFDASSENLSIGYDFSVSENTVIGFSGTYSDIEINERRIAAQETEIDAFQFTAYASHQLGSWLFRGQLSYINGDGDLSRTALGEAVTADFDLDGYSIQAEVNYTFELGKTGYISPLFSLQYADISQGSFTEEGGLNSLVSGSDNEYIEARIGYKLGDRIVAANSLTDLYLTAAFVSNFGDDDDDVNVSFANSAFAQTLDTFDADDERLELGIGVNWFSNDNYSLGASINGQLSDDYYNVGGQVQLKVNF